MPLKIAIVDDHEMFRSGIQFILSEKKEWDVVLEASNGKDFIDQMDIFEPEVVLMDITMPILNGYEATVQALKKNPNIKIIILSMHSDKDYYYKMIEAGVKGFIPKNAGIDELFFAISEVANGKNYFAQDLLKNVILSINENNDDAKIKLNDREKQVLALICNGFTNKEIADKMFLSVKTIEKYRHELIQKTNTRNTAQLVMHAIKNKIIQI